MACIWKSQNLLYLTLSLFVVSFLRGVYSLQITRLSVPDFVQNGTEESVVLDCEYEYDLKNDTSRLVVKWFHNDDPTPIYQWIPELKSILPSGKFGDRINTDYEVTTGDDFTKHRALNILRPTTEISGKYTCHVSSIAGFESKVGVMMVYAPPSALYINYTVIDDIVNIMCIIDGVFPMPEVEMFQIGPGEAESSPVDEVHLEQKIEQNAFNLVLMKNMSEEELDTDLSWNFGCNVTLPGTGYSEITTVPYLPVARPSKVPDDDDDDDDDAASSIQPLVLTISLLVSVHLFHRW